MKNEKEQLKDKILSIEPPKEEVTIEEEELLTDLKNKVISLVDEMYVVDIPTIPQSVADFIEESKQRGKPIQKAIYDFLYTSKEKSWEKWLRVEKDGKIFPHDEEKIYKFIVAYKGEYNLQQYKVNFTTGERLVRIDNGEVKFVVIRDISEQPLEDNETDTFTEQEIKAIDERYWTFAEEVM